MNAPLCEPNRRNHALANAVQALGSVAELARVCGVRVSAAWRWIRRGHLPRTEWTGETHYAAMIENATQGAVTQEQLLSCKPTPRRKPGAS
ncbi:MAG: helix-turn-helix domain-containing protein [Gammaproteobacteria bacterium]|nr:helix-turn-helix domain-containing protein [Gammaproteobacteria bacterium]